MTVAAKNRVLVRALVLLGAAALLAGCATAPPPSKSAPCKRPANLSAYGPISPQDCGRMHPVNTAATAAHLLVL